MFNQGTFMKLIRWIAVISCLFPLALAQAHPQLTTAQYYETIKNNPPLLMVFLHNMPKGADLHNHIASMAENLINYGQNDHLCIDAKTYTASVNSQCSTEYAVANLPAHAELYNKVIDAWSMRNFHPLFESGHDHFFATFSKFDAIYINHEAEILSEIIERAGSQNETYLELMVTPDNNASGSLGKKIGWDTNFSNLRQKLLSNGLSTIVDNIIKNINTDETKIHRTLACNTKNAKAGCKITVRYLYQILREQPPAQVFAQLLAGFELANKDPRFLGINMVQPEDGFISMRDYHLHMQMIGYLHTIYPNVHISLHAGELNNDLVPPEGLRFHIADAINTAHTERIGHGVDISYEDQAEKILNKMAEQHIMVEINLSSNDAILNVRGKDHPILLYMKNHVPIALSTDDEGVLRNDLTEEYYKAILTYHFSYPTLKNLVRNSITYSFLPGNNLWKNDQYKMVNPACQRDILGSSHRSLICNKFLITSEKARMQWELERQFLTFEKAIELQIQSSKKTKTRL